MRKNATNNYLYELQEDKTIRKNSMPVGSTSYLDAWRSADLQRQTVYQLTQYSTAHSPYKRRSISQDSIVDPEVFKIQPCHMETKD